MRRGRPRVHGRSRRAFVLGAERVIAIDRFPERLDLASLGGAETLNYEDVNKLDAPHDGRPWPKTCVDVVGLEAHGTTLDEWSRVDEHRDRSVASD